jgi:HAD superfamily hydrolase (TIGR01509 family)
VKAVVFDCDGVLVDSEPLSEAAWEVVAARYGYAATVSDMMACRGTTSSDTYAYFASRAPLPAEEETLDAVQAELWRRFETDLEAFDDAVETVRRLAFAGVPLAVASSSRRINLDYKLRRFDLGRYFDYVVAGDEVAHGKPAPDLYLAAAAGLGVEASECLAIEDAAAGAEAAATAGMRVVTVARDDAVVPGHRVVDRLDPALILTWMGLA